MNVALFEFAIRCGEPRGPMLLHAMRQELCRELSEAVKACDAVPDWYLDRDRAVGIFRALAEDGDTAGARLELCECFETEWGFGKHLDSLREHVNTLSWAYWRLHRAERRAYGKEGA
jgi:hypothetical protein